MPVLLGVNEPFRVNFETVMGQKMHYIRTFGDGGDISTSTKVNNAMNLAAQGYEVVYSWKPTPQDNTGMTAVANGTWDARLIAIFQRLQTASTPGNVAIYHEPEDLTASVYKAAANRFYNLADVHCPSWRRIWIVQAFLITNGAPDTYYPDVPIDIIGADYYNRRNATDGGDVWAQPANNHPAIPPQGGAGGDRSITGANDMPELLAYCAGKGHDCLICEWGSSRLNPAVYSPDLGEDMRADFYRRWGVAWKDDPRLEGVIQFEQGPSAAQPNQFPNWWIAGSNPNVNPIGVEDESCAQFVAWGAGVDPDPDPDPDPTGELIPGVVPTATRIRMAS